ncbi:hypothetical protein [Flavobacterium sp. GT3R68]|uniref:hypothetical protein n=1 Tax=Flavobacterium sp. GT3R68 TaxID=2594437 RepID=UPI0021059E22|nr:hypothetical protein [Flavobacterium sp. GT3R68]
MVGCKSKKAPAKPVEPTIVKLAPSQIDNSLKEKTYELGTRILMTCNTSKFKPFNTSEATPSVIQNTTQTRLTKTCLKFRLKYGAFKDLDLVEVIHNKTENIRIFRYKALYEKKIANKELRVTLNQDNKVSAINSRDWINVYKP